MGRFAAFGEIMLRLSPPGREMLLQSPSLTVWTAGAEANVVTALARLGHETAMISALPDNDLGQAALTSLRGQGVDCRNVARHGDRMGLYFVTSGAGARATDVIYDRANSAFAETDADFWDWSKLLENVDRLHLSGITPALGPGPAEAALKAARTAAAAGIPVSFDGNWRGKLWARWNDDPAPTLRELVDYADILFGNHRDIALLLGRPFSGEGEDRRREAAAAAFSKFPRLQIIASTARHVIDSDRHNIAARIDTRTEAAQTDEVAVAGIVDRIGGGDAFAAGVLHALRLDKKIDAAAQDGLALAVLKHSLPGDAALFSRRDLEAFSKGEDVRR